MRSSGLYRFLVTLSTSVTFFCGSALSARLPQAITQPSKARSLKTAPSAFSALPKRAFASHAMVAAANPLAVKAGISILKLGGNAVDAAVAIQTVLGLVEPQSSGISGGAFITYYDAKTHKVTAYNGRETAPMGATPDMFLGEDKKPIPFETAVLSGRSTGVPGAMAMLAMAQKEHGRLTWSRLFKPAIQLASQGFVVSPRLAGMINGSTPQAATEDATRYFTKKDGTRYQAGDILKNPEYADTLTAIAEEGVSALLTGSIAQAIVYKLHQNPLGSSMTLADMANYRPQSGPALCRPYRVYVVCTPNAPSGGVGLQEALGLLAHTDIADRGPNDPRAWLEFAEASRLAYADRDYYVGDPDFVKVPVAGLLDPQYLSERAQLIGDKAMPEAPLHGEPQGAPFYKTDTTVEPGGTTHIVIVDREGNALSMTTTVENIFGSGRMVRGFFLNNQLTDFSFSPLSSDQTPAANAVAGGKRPRSTMAPVIVLDKNGKFVAALGSPGGRAIQAYNLKGVVALLDWNMAADKALALPNLIAHGDHFFSDPFPAKISQGLAGLGVKLEPTEHEQSGLQAIIKRGNQYEGGADVRREGTAIGF
ncbi:gamma-glutamyltransferase [Zymomonas mobilis]|uniref:Glutathione hydrolase proenzyme n=1 Tax=Zymomonas mobilis subsp. pomaceae (strain ATCC 29192 / DSM 22645 / JCM 10191 / CCUG 17912 / NBRC 13757 / NCIMB 11200 / NRRL B-4491 / Barker I) TaxID=579138 RepID=F8ERV2_ZYMMT|nr:gamma-glutamyltransferase [Zymomonas mobilis]AEI38565.1 gamma-glutamyltransferase [Zymomonas mobilis subsp. pomaceae ATCC 29192]MDX5948255.1 gamma-glutamyltransferase [Zymomonas mobilis subsp. pomaceae]GEB89010.1 gamma-glutamyltransferase [Zymomonas mobilis subsp. pomaceae]